MKIENKKEMAKKCLGFDVGRSDVKEAYFDEDGQLVLKKYSSAVAKAPMSAEDMPMLDGERYYVGNVALSFPSSDIIETSDSSKIKLISPLLLDKTLRDNGISPEELEVLVTGLSLAEKDEAKLFQNRLTSFKINSRRYNFKDKVFIVPQGVGAKYAIEYFYDELPDAYMIVDIGFSTIDTVNVVDGVVRIENVRGFKDEGIIKIARPLQDYIYKNFKEFISLKEVQKVLEEGKFYIDGEMHDLTDIIKEFSSEYTRHTLDILKQRFSHEFKRYRRIFFVGGGAAWMKGEESALITVVENPEYYNAIGDLIKACDIYKQKQRGE